MGARAGSLRRASSPRAINSGKSGYDGSRLDAGVRIDYQWDDDHLLYAFGQGTLDRSGDIDKNDRIGVGAEVRLTDKIDAVLSDAASAETSFQDTDYVEASLGYAYRPVDNDRLNALFKYIWLYDMSGRGQGREFGDGGRTSATRRRERTYSSYSW